MLQRIMSLFPVASFCLTLPKSFVGNPSVLCFRKVVVAKKFMDKGEGEVSRFPSKIFCLTVPRNAEGEPSSLSLVSGMEKVWIREGAGITIFCQNCFVSQYRKTS